MTNSLRALRSRIVPVDARTTEERLLRELLLEAKLIRQLVARGVHLLAKIAREVEPPKRGPVSFHLTAEDTPERRRRRSYRR